MNAMLPQGVLQHRLEHKLKIDRILEIILYLINNDNVSASYFAEHFNVSVRTIQRDMVSISSIGIPVYSNGGKYGGYSILPTYKMKNADIRSDEQQIIIQALDSLATSYTNETLNSLITKYNSIIGREGGQKVFWDFSVTRENQQVQDINVLLEEAIKEKKIISFQYQNANGVKSEPIAEPLAIHYKWYAWYLFAYLEGSKQYRTYKVARMQNIHITTKKSRKEHGNIQQQMKDSEQAYYNTCIHIEVHFNKEESILINEYFPDCPIEKLNENICRIFIDVPANERLWKALLLSFGKRVKVIAPDFYRDELIQIAKNFLTNYDI